MKRNVMSLLILLLFLCVVSAGCLQVTITEKSTEEPAAEALAEGYETTLFDTSFVHRIDVEIAEEDWNDLLANAIIKTKYKANVIIDGERVDEVSFSTKGNSSLYFVAYEPDARRFSFKINFGKYVDGGNYHGLEKLNLNNGFSDATINMKDYFSYKLFREAGVPAPLTSFVWLTINGKDHGLYLAVEDESESFLGRNTDGEGVIYKPESKDLGLTMEQIADILENGLPMTKDPHGSDLVYVGDDPESYPDIFENNETDAAEQDTLDVLAALKAMDKREDLETWLDTNEIIRFFAAHNYLLNFDSYTGAMLHNLVILERNGKMAIVPWDYNLAYSGFIPGIGPEVKDDPTDLLNQGIDTPLIGAEVDERPLWRWIVSDENYLREYHEEFDKLIASFFESGDFEREVHRLYDLMLPYVEKDPTAFFTPEEFKTGCETFLEFNKRRTESIRKQLSGELSTCSGDQDQESKVDGSDLHVLNMGGTDIKVR